MSKQYRHRRSDNPATAFPTLEPGELAVNTANRQVAVGDAASGSVGAPLALLAIRYFDPRASYAINDFVVQAGVLYKANAAVPPGAFNAVNWTAIAGDVGGGYLPLTGGTLTGTLSIDEGDLWVGPAGSVGEYGFFVANYSTAGGPQTYAQLTSYNNDNYSDGLSYAFARGTKAVPLPLQFGDHIGWSGWAGHDGTEFLSAAVIRAIVDSPVSAGVVPTAVSFCTGTGNDPPETFRIGSDGGIVIPNHGWIDMGGNVGGGWGDQGIWAYDGVPAVNANMRWAIQFGGDANYPSFNILRFNDTGVPLPTPFSVDRTTGAVKIINSAFPLQGKTSGTSLAIDRSLGEMVYITLSGTVTSFTVSNWPTGTTFARLVLIIVNAGAFNITTWPAGTIWPGGTAPTISSGANKRDIIILTTFDGGTTIFGTVAGQDYH